MLDYKVHIDKDSMFNTPPVFAVYTSMLTLEWLSKNGGIKAIEDKNIEKANLLYNAIDSNDLFNGFAKKEDRSLMNVTFNLNDQNHKEHFDRLCLEANISGVNGHRSVGGYRASIYNALDISSVKVLIEAMNQLNKLV
jgi:phosphoserine aminotransferase